MTDDAFGHSTEKELLDRRLVTCADYHQIGTPFRGVRWDDRFGVTLSFDGLSVKPDLS